MLFCLFSFVFVCFFQFLCSAKQKTKSKMKIKHAMCSHTHTHIFGAGHALAICFSSFRFGLGSGVLLGVRRRHRQGRRMRNLIFYFRFCSVVLVAVAGFVSHFFLFCFILMYVCIYSTLSSCIVVVDIASSTSVCVCVH